MASPYLFVPGYVNQTILKENQFTHGKNQMSISRLSSNMKNDIFVPLNEFEKAHYNPRVITPENFQRLKDSIKNHTKNMIDWEESEGLRLVEPIIVNKFNNRLIAGHQRTRALSELNQDWIHVDDIRFINVEDELEEKGLNVKLNSEDLKGDFEEDLLRDIIDQFQEIDIDEISINIGLNTDYINEIIGIDYELSDFENKKNKEKDYQCPKCGFKWQK